MNSLGPESTAQGSLQLHGWTPNVQARDSILKTLWAWKSELETASVSVLT